jgi:hypothetical protein
MAEAALRSLDTFSKLVSAATGYDPVAALPWAAVAFLLKNYRADYATARFTLVGWKVLSKFFNIDDIQNLHWDINCWGDEEVKAWKNNCISGYGAVAVAVRRRIWTQYFISI